MSHAFHQSEGLKVDKPGSVQTVTQLCFNIRDWTEILSPAKLSLLNFLSLHKAVYLSCLKEPPKYIDSWC